jgi:hypothetical protein
VIHAPPQWVWVLYLLAGLVVAYSFLGLNRQTRGPNRFYPDGIAFPFVVALWLPLGVVVFGLWLWWRIRNKGVPR